MTKSKIYNKIQNNFTQVSNLALLDIRLSGKAYKLYAYMVFRIGTAPDWYFYEEEILKNFKESRDAIRSAPFRNPSNLVIFPPALLLPQQGCWWFGVVWC